MGDPTPVATPPPTVEFYNSLAPGAVELPDDPRPLLADAQWARERAIRSGRLRTIPRDELAAWRKQQPPPAAVAPPPVEPPPPAAEVTETPPTDPA